MDSATDRLLSGCPRGVAAGHPIASRLDEFAAPYPPSLDSYPTTDSAVTDCRKRHTSFDGTIQGGPAQQSDEVSDHRAAIGQYGAQNVEVHDAGDYGHSDSCTLHEGIESKSVNGPRTHDNKRSVDSQSRYRSAQRRCDRFAERPLGSSIYGIAGHFDTDGCEDHALDRWTSAGVHSQ